MKKLLFAVLMCVSFLAIAQRDEYGEAVFLLKGGFFTTVKRNMIFESGSNSSFINDNFGEPKNFRSNIQGINYLAKDGWVLQFAYAVYDPFSQSHVYRYMMKRTFSVERIKNDSLAIIAEREHLERLFKQREKQPNHTTDHR